MSQLTLAMNIDLSADLSEAELASLTEALLHKMTKHSIETIEEELGETHRGLKGNVAIHRMELVTLPAPASTIPTV
jgi:hypothetical protein